MLLRAGAIPAAELRSRGDVASKPVASKARSVRTRNIVVIGGSAGAVRPVSTLLKELVHDFQASIFIALHLSPSSAEWLSGHFSRHSGRRVISPSDEQPIEAAAVYIAPPDRHLLIKEGKVLTSRGPRENHWRPAIDVLFRSAAVAHGSRVIAVLMSGELDDGTAGLQAIKACGGVTIVQHPDDALRQTMVRTALANVEVDYTAYLNEMPQLLSRLTREPVAIAVPAPDRLRREALMAEVPQEAPRLLEEYGSPSTLSCPECSGPLRRGGEDGAQFRCLIGHAFHLESLTDGTELEIERTLWAAIRLFEQRANIARMTEEAERAQGRERRAQLSQERAQEAQQHAQRLRELQEHRRTTLESNEALQADES
jgi:two-component system, chemotaxis family, protein-glutamate methylesterase/glutaminase